MCYATAATVRLSIPQGDKALNVNLKQPLQAEGRADALVRERLSTQEAMPETDKQRVRRLAAHCQKYRGSVPRLAALQLLTTIVPLIAIVGAMFATVNQAYWATLLLALPAAGLLVRAFIIQHDCGHGSFFASRALNDFVGRAMSPIWSLAARACTAPRNVRESRSSRRWRHQDDDGSRISEAFDPC